MEIKRKTIENDLEYLRQISVSVDFSNDNYKEFVKLSKEYCSKYNLYALAPVQIGIPKRLIYIKNTTTDMDKNYDGSYNEDIIYINPVIKKEYGHAKFLEGCGSCMIEKDGNEIYYCAEVDRPYKIDVEYYDIDGNLSNKIIEGFEALVFYHEYDHLNGILHIDKSKEIFKFTPDEMREYRLNNPYMVISKD